MVALYMSTLCCWLFRKIWLEIYSWWKTIILINVLMKRLSNCRSGESSEFRGIVRCQGLSFVRLSRKVMKLYRKEFNRTKVTKNSSEKQYSRLQIHPFIKVLSTGLRTDKFPSTSRVIWLTFETKYILWPQF